MIEFLKKEWVFVLSFLAAVLSVLFSGKMPVLTVDDLKVLYVLFVLMLCIKGMERSGLFSSVAPFFETGRTFLKLVLLAGLLSMFVTNDVALLTVVPLTLSLSVSPWKKLLLVSLEALSVNAASALTPFGNPQNIFIYYHYNVLPLEFFKAVLWPMLPLFLGVLALAFLLDLKTEINTPAERPSNLEKKKALIYGSLFAVFVLSVLKILPLSVGIFPVALALLFDRESLKVDYFLLLTFLFFFCFTSSLAQVFEFSIKTPVQTFIYSALASQVISNVPAALLIARFTKFWRALLVGVDVGGFGTLVASLANLIAYKFFAKELPDMSLKYLVVFHVLSFAFLIVGGLLYLSLI